MVHLKINTTKTFFSESSLMNRSLSLRLKSATCVSKEIIVVYQGFKLNFVTKIVIHN